MKEMSISFEVSKQGNISEEEYLPRLLLEVEKNKKSSGFFKKTEETVEGIAEFAIPLFIYFYDKRERGILILHPILAHKKTLVFPEIILHDLDSLEKRFSQTEMDYDLYIKEFSTLITSISKSKNNAHNFNSLPSKNILNDLKKFMEFAYEKKYMDAFLFNTHDLEKNQEIQKINKMLENEEYKLSGLSSNLDAIQELIARKTEILKVNLEEECKRIMVERNKKRRETIDAFKLKAIRMKQLDKDEDKRAEKLLSDCLDRKETIIYNLNRMKNTLSESSNEKQEDMNNSIAEYKDQIRDIDKEIREIEVNANNRKQELHNQLVSLDDDLENFDNETKSIKYEYKEKLQKLNRTFNRFMDTKDEYVLNSKKELTNGINDLSVNISFPDMAENIHESFFMYIPFYIAVFKNDKAGTQRYMIFPPRYINDNTKSLVSSLLTKFKETVHQENFDILLTDNITKILMNDKDIELKVLDHIFNNSITDFSSNKHSTIAKGLEKQKNEEKISEKEYKIIKNILERGEK